LRGRPHGHGGVPKNKKGNLLKTRNDPEKGEKKTSSGVEKGYTEKGEIGGREWICTTMHNKQSPIKTEKNRNATREKMGRVGGIRANSVIQTKVKGGTPRVGSEGGSWAGCKNHGYKTEFCSMPVDD